jgi:hypothetical protein
LHRVGVFMLRRVILAGLATCWLILTISFSQTVNAGWIQFNDCCTGVGVDVGINSGYNWLPWNNNILVVLDASLPIAPPRTLSCSRTQETITVRSRESDTRQITITRC